MSLALCHRLSSRIPLPRFFGTVPPAQKNDIFQDDNVFGPGSSDLNLIATAYEQSVGLERLELLCKLSGRTAFLMDPLKVDHYGTAKDPILVDSVVGKRLVGCTGFPKYSHETLWFWVKEDQTMRCLDCGQAFRINKLH